MFPEHSMVVLTRNISELGVRLGDVGTIVHIYPGGAAYEVEFGRIKGKSDPLATLELGDIRPATPREIELAFPTASAAK